MMMATLVWGQGQKISWKKKSTEPIILSNNDTLRVKQKIKFLLGSNTDGSYKFVQMLNNFNEPIKPADSRIAMMKQPIIFFKSQDDVHYAFTKYFAINIEAALLTKEIEILTE